MVQKFRGFGITIDFIFYLKFEITSKTLIIYVKISERYKLHSIKSTIIINNVKTLINIYVGKKICNKSRESILWDSRTMNSNLTFIIIFFLEV